MFKLFYDFETYYDDVYSLRKMTNIEYVLDPRFEALGCAFAFDNERSFWVDGPDLPKFWSTVDLDSAALISHNALFDALIATRRYRVMAKQWGCSLSMARNWWAHKIGSVALEACAKFLGLPPKMDTLKRTKGVNFQQLLRDPVLHQEVKVYGCDDVDKCRIVHNTILADGFPEGQLEIIDWVVRMCAIPQLEIDANLVAEHLGEVLAFKQKLLDDAGLDTRKPLMSDDTLAAALTMLGVHPVPRKTSKATGKEQWAFAKTDREFTSLVEHPNPAVQAIVAARLGHKSTIEETRARRFQAIAQVTTRFPVPLKYSGAHTHRFSGEWSLNLQNLVRGGKLRRAIRAPKGCVVVSIDASQIEARLNATLSGETGLVESFRAGEDVYCDFASTIYQRPIVKALHPEERYVGKTGILSLGYGSSWPVFQNMVRTKSPDPSKQIILTDAMAVQAVMAYRARFPRIVEHWKEADKQIIPMIAQGRQYRWGALQVERDALVLPNGNRMHYLDLRHEYDPGDDRFQWTFFRGNGRHKLYGAKVVENECQSLAFVHLCEVAMEVKRISEGYLLPVHQVHDELLYVVPEKLGEQVGQLVQAEMSKPPVWLPQVPLAAEYHIGLTYGDAK